MNATKNEPANREPAVLHERRGERPRASRRSYFIMLTLTLEPGRVLVHIDELLELLPFWGSRQAMERTQPKNPEAGVEPKYEPIDDELGLLD